MNSHILIEKLIHISKNVGDAIMDVDKSNVIALLDSLDKDEKFIGGAIAVPYKEVVAKLAGKQRFQRSTKNWSG